LKGNGFFVVVGRKRVEKKIKGQEGEGYMP